MAKHRKSHSSKNKRHEKKPKKKQSAEHKTNAGSKSHKKSHIVEEKGRQKANFPKAAIISAVAIAIIVISIFLFTSFNKHNNIQEADNNSQHLAKEKASLQFYVMSQCPYGIQVVNAIAPVLEKLKGYVDFSLNYIASEKQNGFASLHGNNEVNGDIVQLCAAKYNPDSYLNMIVCQNKNPSGIPDNWESCAKENNMDVENIKSCYSGEEGKQLLRQSIAESKKANAQGSPTIYINGKLYTGGRSPDDFLRALCKTSSLNASKPEACNNLPEPVKVDVILLNDNRCEKCSKIAPLISQLKTLFPGMQLKELDYSDKEGKELYKSLSLKYLPAVLFSKNIANASNYQMIERYLVEQGGYYSLRIGADFNPEAEICDNNIDDDNDNYVDCADPDCKGEFVCMEKKDKPEVELFVMGYCPYGLQMEKAIIPVVELLKGKISFDVKFVYYAMHGEKEIKEQLRQWCIETGQNSKYLSYLKCFVENGDTEACLDTAGIDKQKLASCVEKTDKEFSVTESYNNKSSWLSGRFPLFNVNKKDNEKYKVAGSPTMAINGVVAENVARNPDALLKAICLGFKDKPEECSKELSTETPKPGFGTGTTQQESSGSCG